MLNLFEIFTVLIFTVRTLLIDYFNFNYNFVYIYLHTYLWQLAMAVCEIRLYYLHSIKCVLF